MSCASLVCLLDCLPLELIYIIAKYRRGSYRALVIGYPRFARTVTAGIRVDFAIWFGYDFRADIYQKWMRNGMIHRADGPAVMYLNSFIWYWYGRKHRIGGPAALFKSLELCSYCDEFHRGFARCCTTHVANGCQHWYERGKRHRIGAPAVIHCNGSLEYWVHGIRYF